jgi:hypothetical protein
VKKFIQGFIILAVMGIFGCSAQQQVNQQAVNDSKSFSEFIDSVKTVTLQDIQTALADVHAKGDQDLAALQCYPALSEFLQSDVNLKVPTVDGIITANQLKRDILLGVSSGNSPVKQALRKLHTACAAYVSDERRFALEFAALIGSRGAVNPALIKIPGL